MSKKEFIERELLCSATFCYLDKFDIMHSISTENEAFDLNNEITYDQSRDCCIFFSRTFDDCRALFKFLEEEGIGLGLFQLELDGDD